jgi:hypothetical protein
LQGLMTFEFACIIPHPLEKRPVVSNASIIDFSPLKNSGFLFFRGKILIFQPASTAG